ncbi:unnamed protein product [Oppiella nova]|uniref:glutathione transferase n=1 Tax=Oppiella nova TaxID=334625 RepID=A0A7R9QS81_9ACAR|nr:unnamed protein product [Oppiella nova]CAG2173483.1 unnamed protein product [Oppiella nova]
MAVTVGYWDLRGLGQPIRFLLQYVGIAFTDVRYRIGHDWTDPDLREDWLRVKWDLGLDFPNLPYYIEGELKLTHSRTILRYLGSKHGLCGQTDAEKTRIDMIENYMEDMRNDGLRHVVYSPVFDPKLDFETLKAEYISKMGSYFREISNFLDTFEWMAGNRLTFVDFWCYEVLDWNRLFQSDCLNECHNLLQYMNRFEALPPINRYINSDQFNRFPIFAPYARFGGQPHPD